MAFLWEQFTQLQANFLPLAERIKHLNGGIAWEWPQFNKLWEQDVVKNMLDKLSLITQHFHGCMLGLKSMTGWPMKKPWMVATDVHQLRHEFIKYICDGKCGWHQPVEGSETARTSLYTWNMTDLIHDAFVSQSEDFEILPRFISLSRIFAASYGALKRL